MAAKNKAINPLELKGAERVFQIDRDTILIYTGLHRADVRPFSRIGAGYSLPLHLLPMVEHVILPESHLWNIAVEDAWLRSGIDAGTGKVSYVGSKERVNQVHRYFDIETYVKAKEKEALEKARASGLDRKKGDTQTEMPVDFEVYSAPLRGEDNRNKCLITYLATGDYQVSVGSSRVLDSGSYYRARITIDKEYALISKALSKFDQPARNGFSFIPFEGEGVVSNLWNFNGSLLLAEPVPDYHYRLLEVGIDADRVSMAISGSVYQPGFIEVMRRSDATGRVVGVSTPDTERLGLVKRIFNFAQPKIFSEGGALPLARGVSYYESRSRSHGAFVFRTRDDTDQPVQILFPYLRTKESRSFDFIKGPFDLEFSLVNDASRIKEDFAGAAVLFARGAISEKVWKALPVSEGRYPVVPGCEYRMKQVLHHEDVVDAVRPLLAGTEFETPVIEILSGLGMAEAQDDLSGMRDAFYIVRTQAVPKDPILRMNLGSALHYIEIVLSRMAVKDHSVVELARKVSARFTAKGLRFGDLSVFAGGLRFDVLMHTGVATLVLGQPSGNRWNIRLRFPPDAEHVVALEREYRKYLKEQQRIVDKTGSSQRDRAVLEVMERLFDETLHRGHERARLYALLESLAVQTPTGREATGLPFHMKLPYWMRVVVETLRLPELAEWMRGQKRRVTAGKGEKGHLSRAAMVLLGVGVLLGGAYTVSRLARSGAPGDGAAAGQKSPLLALLERSADRSAASGADDVKKN